MTSDPELEDLLKEILPDDTIGAALHPSVAAKFQSLMNREPSKEELEKYKVDFRTPENADMLCVPAIQSDLWNNPKFPRGKKAMDLRAQGIQHSVVRAQIGVAQLVDDIFQNSTMLDPTLRNRLVRKSFDVANNLGMAVRSISTQRRLQIKGELRPELATICNKSIQHSKNLFGEDLEANVKSSKAADSIFKTTNFQQRFKPYNKGQGKGQPNLNFKRRNTWKGGTDNSKKQFRKQWNNSPNEKKTD